VTYRPNANTSNIIKKHVAVEEVTNAIRGYVKMIKLKEKRKNTKTGRKINWRIWLMYFL
jgi:hypothetical protein